MTDNIKSKYQSKAADSFKTKLDFFLFEMAIQAENIADSAISAEDFSNFKIQRKIIDRYVTEYWQTENVDAAIINGLSANQIYEKINRLKNTNKSLISSLKKKYINADFLQIFPYDEFKALCAGTECHYCHITEDKIKRLISQKKLYKKHITRGWTLEIDRKFPNLEYTKENSVLCCYWCNNAKTDEFCEKEFLKIGEVIKKIWDSRLGI